MEMNIFAKGEIVFNGVLYGILNLTFLYAVLSKEYVASIIILAFAMLARINHYMNMLTISQNENDSKLDKVLEMKKEMGQVIKIAVAKSISETAEEET